MKILFLTLKHIWVENFSFTFVNIIKCIQFRSKGSNFFNHESPRRSNEYVTQKKETAINIKKGNEKILKLVI